MDEKLALLLKYAKAGFYILPIHWPISKNKCSCSYTSCNRIGKHPRTHNGVKEATRTLKRIVEWHRLWPEANWALATGNKSGILVIDLDVKSGGLESIKDFRIPLTPSVTTGSGGKHYYFRHPKEPVKNTASKVRKGIDVRTDDGYVIIPPSKHASGNFYYWEVKPSFVGGFAAVPEDLLAEIIKVSKEPVRIDSDDGLIEEGNRNTMLISMAGWMRYRGFNAAAIEAALLAVNEIACNPPIPEEEVVKLTNSSLKWGRGASSS